MKIRILCFSFICFVFSALCFSASVSGQPKIGYLNSNVIMNRFNDAVEVSKKVNELAQEYEKERQQLEAEYQAKNKEFESQRLLLSEERKRESLQEIQELYQKLLKFNEEKFGPQGELERRTKELTEPVIKKIQGAIDKIAREDLFDYVFDTVNANLVFAREKEFDITERVLTELNKGIVGGQPGQQ